MALICCVLNFLIPGLGKHYFSSVTYEVWPVSVNTF
jgi:hypothetical protein